MMITVKVMATLIVSQEQPPEVFYKKGVLKNFAKFTGKHPCQSLLLTLEPLNDQCSHHIESSQLICRANQLTAFYMMGTLVVKGLIKLKASDLQLY